MRIWDIHPGYLNRGSLLGEHRELHGMFNIIREHKRGYANHPETKRWQNHLDALCLRHELLVAEMTLRGYQHKSPLPQTEMTDIWPAIFIDEPGEQFQILSLKYRGIDPGRIPLPRNCQSLWDSHKYSVLARDQKLYRSLGPSLARSRSQAVLKELAATLVEVLRRRPSPGGVQNALEHMWGHVRDPGGLPGERKSDNRQFLIAIIARNAVVEDSYLRASTALSELAIW